MKKTWTSREFSKLLRDNGYVRKRQSGDHLIYEKDGKIISFTYNHLNRMLVKRLIKDYHLIA